MVGWGRIMGVMLGFSIHGKFCQSLLYKQSCRLNGFPNTMEECGLLGALEAVILVAMQRKSCKPLVTCPMLT
jgi:hypothetical protein